MEIVVGKTSGFCFGVKNAVEKTEDELKNNNQLYCLGELVHNKNVIQELRSKGLKMIDDLNQIEDSNNKKIIIRAHGTTKEIYTQLRNLGIEIIDLTCPKVLQIHKTVEKYKNDGYFILYIGEKNHPETIGTISFGDGNIGVIETQDDIKPYIDKIKANKMDKVLVISQTTFSLEKFNAFSEIIKNSISAEVKIEVNNTICQTTRLRQEEAEEISKKVDCMIIIGGKNSANTRKLYDISLKYCDTVYLIENKEEALKLKKEINQYHKIGIMAGNSTPNTSIEEIKKVILL